MLGPLVISKLLHRKPHRSTGEQSKFSCKSLLRRLRLLLPKAEVLPPVFCVSLLGSRIKVPVGEVQVHVYSSCWPILYASRSQASTSASRAFSLVMRN